MIWIGNYAIQLSIDDSLISANTVIKHKKGNGNYSITLNVGTYHNEYAQREGQPSDEEMLSKMEKPPFPYKGKALFAYKYQGKNQTFVIPKILTHLPDINYP